ncbi:hypothetical protein B0H65DRAFT_576977 [Neurospora tetraspora]|uniref:Lytic polysaccharide monooxygenase n=1 Tax=Neurospora tetraspora TaxID=94610 RepID=A0AAE0MQV6_9PEZI|nr:hypothetical protein B0H65DRAFT_576977 [Neurospora tetraspora]
MSFSPLSTAGAAAKQVFALLLLLLTMFTPLVASHAILATPIPYAASHQKNGPIDGTTFPCQGGAGATYQLPASGYNIFPLGSKQPLVLQGTAVHGGGSCQISITYDNPPTPQSKFKVIKSIEGGCIARNEPGNRPGGTESAEKVNPDQYEYVIPDDIPTGNGTIAWTWFNKIGNREMYMACGGVQLTGTDKPGAKETFERLPDIFMANIGNGCGTPDSKDVLFPNPGRDVEKANGKTRRLRRLRGRAGGGAVTSAAAGGASATGATGAGAMTTAPYPVANKTATAVTGAPTVSGNTFAPGVFITKPSVDGGAPVATGAASVPPASSVAAPPVSSVSACSAPTDAATSPSVPSTLLTSTIPASASPPPPAANPPAITAAPVAGSGSGTSAPRGDCPASQDGWYVCHLLSNSHYGTVYHRCASGKWTAAMQVPAGMRCTIKGDANGNAEARGKPEQELTLGPVDDGPLVIVPVTMTTVAPNAPLRPTAASGAAPGKRAAQNMKDMDENGDEDKDGDVELWVLPMEGGNKNNDGDEHKPKLKLKKREEDDQDQDQDSSSSTTAHERDLKHDLETIASTKLLPRLGLEARRKRKGRPRKAGKERRSG